MCEYTCSHKKVVLRRFPGFLRPEACATQLLRTRLGSRARNARLHPATSLGEWRGPVPLRVSVPAVGSASPLARSWRLEKGRSGRALALRGPYFAEGIRRVGPLGRANRRDRNGPQAAARWGRRSGARHGAQHLWCFYQCQSERATGTILCAPSRWTSYGCRLGVPVFGWLSGGHDRGHNRPSGGYDRGHSRQMFLGVSMRMPGASV